MPAFLSKDVLAYMEENHREFTDFEKAALIAHAGLPVLKTRELLEKLAKQTEDASLQEQILDRLAVEQQDMEAFRNNTAGYVYAVEVRDDEDAEPYVCGYFATSELAYAHGMKQGGGFEIIKYCIVGHNGRAAKKAKSYLNPYLLDTEDVEACMTQSDYCGESDAVARYDKAGTLQYFWSAEIERSDAENISRSFDHARFENAFIPVPNPFESGDIVRTTSQPALHGIVATSQQQWNELLEQVESGNAKWADFIDASITVDFLLEDGQISHEHISPAYLEKFEPQEDDADYDVLMSARAVRHGGALDLFLTCLDKYQKRLKNA